MRKARPASHFEKDFPHADNCAKIRARRAGRTWDEKRDAHRMTDFTTPANRLSVQLASVLDRKWFKNLDTGIVILNAIVLGVLTYRDVLPRSAVAGLDVIDSSITYIFLAEIAAKIFAYRRAFFKDGWNVFDASVVGVSLLPGANAFSVLRALRVLRIFRLLHIVPIMKRITEALLKALPGMGAIAAVLALVIYVAAVMATMMYGHSSNPDVQAAFGTLPNSAFSLFQVMTGDGWSDVVRLVMSDGHPYAWAFFMIFIFVASFAVLNLFIALIVDALADEQKEIMKESIEEMEVSIEEKVELQIDQMEEKLEDKVEEGMDNIEDDIQSLERVDQAILATLKDMRNEIAALKVAIERGGAK